MVSSIQWSIFAGVVVMVSSLITLFSLSASSSLASNVVDKPGTLDSQGGICQTTVPNFTGGQSEATSCRPRLKIYVYDLPRKFNFGLFPKSDFKSPENELPWNSSEIPEWPGGNRTAKHQHSVAYYLYTDLLLKDNVKNSFFFVPFDPKVWLLPKFYPQLQNSPSGSMAIRVKNPEDADVFFVPFFASLSFNRFGKFRLGKINQVDRALQVKRTLNLGLFSPLILFSRLFLAPFFLFPFLQFHSYTFLSLLFSLTSSPPQSPTIPPLFPHSTYVPSFPPHYPHYPPQIPPRKSWFPS